MSNEVGFAFQADVVNLGSLTHMMTGRVLKALSDGGVDTYAVAAAFWLGAKIPVRLSLVDTVHMHVSKRPTYHSIFNKLLTIGWGHSTPVIEMTRTRAGTNALLLVGALGEVVSPYVAAQCLSELLAVYGMGLDAMPSTDVLKGLVVYLTPFVHDLGFSKVLQHITDVTKVVLDAVAIQLKARGDDRAFWKTKDHLHRFRCLGPPDSLAGAIKQLVYTSQKCQEHYMILEMAGSWLPAFASHLLDMSVELRYGDKLIWASGGENGSVAFQIGNHPQHGSSTLSSLGQLTIVACPDPGLYNEPVPVTYSVEDALDSLLLEWPEIDSDLALAIHTAIRRLALGLFRGMVSIEQQYCHNVSKPLGTFNGIMALKTVLDILHVREDKVGRTSWTELHEDQRMDNHVPLLDRHELSNRYGTTNANALAEIDAANCIKLIELCAVHQKHQPSATNGSRQYNYYQEQRACLCKKVGAVIYGFAVTALALMQCKFDPSQLRLEEDVLVGKRTTEWSESIAKGATFVIENPFTPYLMDHLASLVCSDYKQIQPQNRREWDRFEGALGISSGAYTIYHSLVMNNDCYDEVGCMIQIHSGRASFQGSLRNLIRGIRSESYGPPCGYGEILEPTQLAGSSRLETHYRPPKTKVELEVQLAEDCIFLDSRLRFDAPQSQALRIDIAACIDIFRTQWMVPRCQHDVGSPYKVKNDRDLAVEGFHPARLVAKAVDFDALVFALKGNKLEQILACGLMKIEDGIGKTYHEREIKSGGVLQVLSCLECSLRLARQLGEDVFPCVVMGG